MEPVTHLLTGACLSRTGLNRRAAYATLTMVIAAEFPDIDTLWSFRGPIEGFQHHRGITHTFLGLPFEAALIVAAVYGLHRWRVARAKAKAKATATAKATANTGVLRLRAARFAQDDGEERATAGATTTATTTTNTGVLRLRAARFAQDDGEERATAGATTTATTTTNTGVLRLRAARFAQDDGEERATAGAKATTKATANATATATANTGVLRLRAARSAQDDGEERATANATATVNATTRANAKPLTDAPVRWGVLYGLALLALLSHLLLDYTNNYGLRPFFPFNDHWYAASFVFIFDPVMFAILLGALVAPWLFGLVSAEVGAKKQPFRGRGWAIAALLGVVGWWGLRAVEHGRAVQMAMTQSIAAPAESVATPPMSQSRDPLRQAQGKLGAGSGQTMGHPDSLAEPVPTYLQTQRALASPDMLSPFRWSAVMDFGPVYQLAEIDTRGGTETMGETTYPKPGRSAAVLTAEQSRLGRVYMDWSPMPIVEVTKSDSELAGEASGGPAAKVVRFRDPRFMGGWISDQGWQPLMGTVGLDAAGRVVRETMDGRIEPVKP